MPFKTDKLKLADPFLKRSAKLLPCQREMIHWHYARGVSINALARLFKVNKRLIQFELFPERAKKNVENRKARGGSKIYYVREKHTKAIREHRQYKRKTLNHEQTQKRTPPQSSGPQSEDSAHVTNK